MWFLYVKKLWEYSISFDETILNQCIMSEKWYDYIFCHKLIEYRFSNIQNIFVLIETWPHATKRLHNGSIKKCLIIPKLLVSGRKLDSVVSH